MCGLSAYGITPCATLLSIHPSNDKLSYALLESRSAHEKEIENLVSHVRRLKKRWLDSI